MKARITAMCTFLVLAVLTGSSPATAAPTDAKLTGMLGSPVVVRTVQGATFHGVLSDVGAGEVSLHLETGKDRSLQRNTIRSIEPGRTPRSIRIGRSTRRAAQAASQTDDTLTRSLARHNLERAKRYVTVGALMLAAGAAGLAGGVVLIRRTQRIDTPSRGAKALGSGFVTTVGSVATLAGLGLLVEGTREWVRCARALKRLRPQVTIDPARRQYAASVTFSF